MAKYNKLKKSKGFALVESAVSLIVVGTVFMSYQNQEISKKMVSEALNYSKTSQQAVSEYYRLNGVLPSSNNQANVPAADNVSYPGISNLMIGEFGEITITLDGGQSDNAESIDNKTIILEPKVSDNTVTWTCDHGSLENAYRPDNCFKDEMNRSNAHELDELLDYVIDGNFL